MDNKRIQDIIKNFDKSKANSLEIEMDNFKLKLSKSLSTMSADTNTACVEQKIITEIQELKNEQKIEQKQPKNAQLRGDYEVKFPLVGTFYAANSPTAEPFVRINQRVEKGQTLCIIEAMKIMNEIVSPVSGTIVTIDVKNGTPVGYDKL